MISTIGTENIEFKGKLVKAVVLFRHGARSPLNRYEFHNLPDEDEKMWLEGYGNLIRTGKKQLYQLGKNIRQLYRTNLLPYNETTTEDIRAVTTATRRTYESADLLLAGLYSPLNDQRWSKKLQRQPIPILYNSPDRIHIIGRRNECPNYYDELHKSMPDVNRTDVRYLINYISSQVSSKNISTITDLFFLADYFVTKRSLNFSLPQWMSEDNFTRLVDFHKESYNYLTKTFKLRRLLAGPLITDIIFRMKEFIYADPNNSKIYFYSVHDSSLHSLARTLGFEVKFVPNFASSFLFELYHISSQDYRIKLLYSEDYSMNKLSVWVIPGCSELCPIGKFVQLVDKFLINSWEHECNTT